MSDYLGLLVHRISPTSTGIVPSLVTPFEAEPQPATTVPAGLETEATTPVSGSSSPENARVGLASIDALWPATPEPPKSLPSPARPASPLAPSLPAEFDNDRPRVVAPADQPGNHPFAAPVIAVRQRVTGAEVPAETFAPSSVAEPARRTERISSDDSKSSVVSPVRPWFAEAMDGSAGRIRPRESPPVSVPSPRSASPAAPSIHITIGRVEVRANVQPSTRQVTTPTRATKVSLEEHLSGRPGGSRP